MREDGVPGAAKAEGREAGGGRRELGGMRRLVEKGRDRCSVLISPKEAALCFVSFCSSQETC